MKRQLLLLPLLLLLALLGWPRPGAAQTLATATLTATGQDWTVGDPLPLTLTVNHPAGTQVIFPQLPGEWGDFTVVSQSPATSVTNADGSKTTNQQIDARLFAPGQFSTPTLTVTLADNAGQLSDIMVSPAVITINSVLTEDDRELRDIKPQAELPVSNLALWITALLLAVAAGSGGWLWQRQRARLAPAGVDNRLPHEVALAELARIESLELPQQGQFKTHYTLVSGCVRRYLEQTYGVPMLERTTGEVRASLRQIAMHPDTARQLAAFLDESDLVKFANFTPGITDAAQLLALARALVESSRPLVIMADDVAAAGQRQPGFSANGTQQKAEARA